MAEKGHIAIHTENILPIIKKWLYSDREIFIRELVSNAVDANSKLKKLSLTGEYESDLEELFVNVKVDKKNKTLTFSDNGIGMTADEIKKYINQIAFSGAEDFIKKHKTEEGSDIIGHFGLGFYSAFMVSDKVEIISKSYTGEKATHWENDGGTEFVLEDDDKGIRGTDVILHINDENKDFLEDRTVKEVILKYCNFLPYTIKLNGEVINDKSPLWLKSARDVKEEDYKEFYSKLFPYESDPLFWIHLDVEVPFRLKGILYFPKLKHELDSSKGRIKLFCNQVFVTDNSKEIIPEFLTLLQGTLDIPDLPLNVSRSYLQNDIHVKKISDHITKKVADKLTSIFKKDRETYEKYWDDMSIFIKYGMMNNDKFYEKLKDIVLYKTTDGVYKTLEEYKEKNKGVNITKGDKEVVLYASDEEQQAALINMIKSHGQEAVILNSMIDNHFMQLLEMKDNKISFIRIDSDDNEVFRDSDNSEDSEKGNNEAVQKIFEDILKKDNDHLKVKVDKLKNENVSSMIVFSEQMRRFKEMSRMMSNENMDLFSDLTLVVNSNNKIIKNIVDLSGNENNADKVNNLVNNVYDLALLSQNNLKGDRLVKFIERSSSIMAEIN